MRTWFKVAGILVLSVFFLFWLYAYAQADVSDSTIDHSALLTAKDETIATLRWIGGSIVVALAGTVAFLYKDLAGANKVIQVEIKDGAALKVRMIEALEKLPLSCPLNRDPKEQ